MSGLCSSGIAVSIYGNLMLGRGLVLRLLVVHCDNDTNDHSNNDEDDNNDEQAPPLLAVTGARADDRGTNLFVTLCDVIANLLAIWRSMFWMASWRSFSLRRVELAWPRRSELRSWDTNQRSPG
jgi:hypothetical protein